MGLDIYVGPLTRYYTGNWKTVIQQAAEAAGMEVRVVRQNEPPADAITDPSVVHGAVMAWRVALVRGAGGFLPSLDWTDAPQGDYFTDKPDWDGYWAVRFLAGHDEFPDVRAPSQVLFPSKMGDPTKEQVQRRVAEVYGGKPSGSGLGRFLGRGKRPEAVGPPRYPHLHLAEFWLPADFEGPFRATDLAGNSMMFGSVPRLKAELDLLNERTLRGDMSAMEEWRRAGPPEDDRALEPVGKFGLSILLAAVNYGVDHQLPMKMDY